MELETEAVAGNTTINPEAASTAMETPVVMTAVDAAAAPDAGNSGSSGGVDVSSGERQRR